ncbi:MAG: molybdopterin molybdotransferase MoeA [Acidimicrobiia bacterium]|nr:molybdopterin molybdotransferase MoeA [Acidimicrobiia bacterium]
MSLTPLEEVQAAVLRQCPPLTPRAEDLQDALGCVTSTALEAEELVPPFDNTAMDGFAVQAADTADPPVELKIVGTLAAGAAPELRVGGGEAVRIMTGAPMPPGADAVVMVERTRTEGDVVVVEHRASAGDHIRRAGDDLKPGDVVVDAGTVLTPAHLGVLASLGYQRVPVFPRPRVGVLSTGDELVAGASVLRVGQIRDSNRPTLLALVRQSGFEPVDLGLAPDDEAAIADAVERGLATCDALVTSGGVSVGDFDYVKTVLDRLGSMRSWQVAIKPAKPLAFGTVRGKPVFGLPGNPVSSMVSFELFAGPALRQMGGHRRLFRPQVRATVVEPIRRRPDGKLHLVRVVAVAGEDPSGDWRVRPVDGQGSHQLAAAAAANALALVPDGEGAAAGSSVSVLLLSGAVGGDPC